MGKKSGRAANGMGSIRQRADGRWEGRYSAPNGLQKSVYGKTQKECAEKLKTALHEIDVGNWLEPSKMTVGEWCDYWADNHQGHTTGRTVTTYKNIIRLYIKPACGDVKLKNVSAVHVRRMVYQMTVGNASPATVQQVYSILSGCMKSAVEDGLIKANPAQNVKTPKIVKRKFAIVDRDSIPAFIRAAGNTPYGNALVFLLMTGLRAGELRGLRWEDVDFDAGELHVERQLHNETKQTRRFAPPKDGGTRTIQLPADALELLRRQRRAQLEQRVKAGGKWTDDEFTTGLVFRTKHGRFMSEPTLHKYVHAVGAEINMPDLRPHDLRHSYAVAALRSGIDVKTVQNNLGHKNAAMTLDTYAAYTTDAGKVGAKRFEEYWQDALKESN